MTGTVKATQYEVSLRYSDEDRGQTEILAGLLISAGVERTMITELYQWPWSYLSVFFADSHKANRLSKQLEQLDLKNVTVTTKRLLKKDWQTKWEDDFRPFALTPRLEVVPKWRRKNYRNVKLTPLYLDTGLAFGTGLHATTRMMANFVERYAGRFYSFLDVGTGSGILSLVALKSGAKKISAIDQDKNCIDVAKSNFMLNHYPPKGLRAINLAKFNPKTKYDFVAANLISKDIVKFKRKLVSLVEEGKYLALSGIAVNNYDIVRQSLAGLPLRCLKVAKGDGWIAILYKKC